MQHVSQETSQYEDNPALAKQFFAQYKQLKQQGKKYQAWDKLGQAIIYGYDTVKEICDEAYIVANQIEDEALALYNGDRGEVNDRFYSEAYEMLTRYLVFDRAFVQKSLSKLRAQCLGCFEKFREGTLKGFKYAQREDISLHRRIKSLNVVMRTAIDEEKRQMNRLRSELIPRFKAELVEKIPAICDAATTDAGYQQAHEICQEAEKAVPEVPFFRGLRWYVLFRVQVELFSNIDPRVEKTLDELCEQDADIKHLTQHALLLNGCKKSKKAIETALIKNDLDEAIDNLWDQEKFGFYPEYHASCVQMIKDHMRYQFHSRLKEGDVKGMQEFLGPHRLGKYPDYHTECQQKLQAYQKDLKQVKNTAHRIALEVMIRCRGETPFKSRSDQKSYDALTEALHKAILTSLNQGDRNRFLIDFKYYVESKKGLMKDPYKEDQQVNELITQLVSKLQSTCFEESKSLGKVKLKVSDKQFNKASVDSVISTRTERFQPDKERLDNRSSSHSSDTGSSHQSSEDTSPTNSRSQSPTHRAMVPPLAKPPQQKTSSQGRVAKKAPRPKPKVTPLPNRGPVFGAGQHQKPLPSAPQLSPTSQVQTYGYYN